LCNPVLAAQCAASDDELGEGKKGIVSSVEEISESGTSEELIETEDIPLNNCGGNSPLIVDVERSREVIYAITDDQGRSFGITYFFLRGELDKRYGKIDGKKETRTYTIRLETEANSHVVYVIAWKEVWLNGTATVRVSGAEKEIPYRVKTALRFEIQDIKDVGCK